MKGTIFQKLVLMFVTVLLIAFTLTGTILYYFLDSFVIKDKEQNLENAELVVEKAFLDYLDTTDDPYYQALARNNIDILLDLSYGNYKSLSWIVDSNGRVLFSSPKLLPEIVGSGGKGYDFKLNDKKQYEDVFKGDKDFYVSIGDFNGFFSSKYFTESKGVGNSWLIIRKPIIVNKASKQVIAAVFMMTPVPEIQKARSSVFGYYITAMLISIFISVILVYIFSRQITKPLKEINDAARVIAGGEFSKRLTISSNDEIGQLAGSFNQMVVALGNLEEMRKGFIANVSHELRTPMTSIKGFVEGIIDGTIPQNKQTEYLRIVSDEATRLNKLVNNLLDLARLESAEHKLNVIEFDLNELVRLSIINLENQITDKQLNVDALFNEDILMVKADKDEIRRVLINILHNAIKFTPMNGNIEIVVETGKDCALVTIKDSGIGIEPEEIDNIWDRFYKTDKSRGKDKTGTGLGLALVKTIMNEHHQKIWAESEIGKGTKFTFTLNLADD